MTSTQLPMETIDDKPSAGQFSTSTINLDQLLYGQMTFSSRSAPQT